MKNIINDLNRSLPPRRRKSPTPHRQFEELEAASLFCPKCRQAVPVRKKLLLVLPEGEKYDYLCIHCGSPVGSKTSREETSVQFVGK